MASAAELIQAKGVFYLMLIQDSPDFLHQILLTFSAAVIKNQRIPFQIEGAPFYSEENMKRLRKSIAEAEAGHTTVHKLVKVE